ARLEQAALRIVRTGLRATAVPAYVAWSALVVFLARSVGQDAPVLDAFETADAVLFIFYAVRGVTVLAEGVQPFAVFLGWKEVGTAVVLAAALDHVTLLARWLQVEAAKLAGAVQAR